MPTTLTRDVPDRSLATAVRALAAAVETEDGAPPLSDQTLAHLTDAGVGHLVARDRNVLVGYAQVADGTAELAATPDALAPLLDAVLTARPEGIWAHGARSRLAAPLAARGLVRARELLQLRRPGDLPLPADPPLPDGVVVRPFEPGRDDAAWLALNAAAFASHPEQGRMTQADLDARRAEEWFDPVGFLLAERGGDLLGFHWTKVHPDGAGEVYVLGIAPAAQGLGLGGSLLVRGLRLLAARGVPHVLLYVEGDNAPALHLYRRAGFTDHDVDVRWSTP